MKEIWKNKKNELEQKIKLESSSALKRESRLFKEREKRERKYAK